MLVYVSTLNGSISLSLFSIFIKENKHLDRIHNLEIKEWLQLKAVTIIYCYKTCVYVSFAYTTYVMLQLALVDIAATKMEAKISHEFSCSGACMTQ